MDVKVTVKTERTLRLPVLPNFIRDTNDQPVPIESLQQEQLQEIGRAWTEALCRKARNLASERTARLNAVLRKQRAG